MVLYNPVFSAHYYRANVWPMHGISPVTRAGVAPDPCCARMILCLKRGTSYENLGQRNFPALNQVWALDHLNMEPFKTDKCFSVKWSDLCSNKIF